MEGDIKREMSSEAPEQSPLDRAKAEANELIQKVQDDLDSIRTAPVNELEMRINSLRDSFQASQESAIVNVETALKSSDTRIDDLERGLRAEKKRTTNLAIDLANHKYKAETKYGQLKVLIIDFALQRSNHGLTKSYLHEAKSELEEANRRAADLQNNFRAVQQRNIDLQAELGLAEQQPANLEERLKEVEQRNAGLETDLRSATQRASTAEDELKAFKFRFKLINDDMNALASSSEQQLTVTKPVPSFTPPPIARPSVTGRSYAQLSTAQPSFALPQHQQGAMVGRKGGPQRHDTSVRAQSLDSHASNSTGDKEPDVLHCRCILNGIMDRANPLSKCYFFSPVNTDTRALLTSQNAKLGPINLSIMKERLARGDYMSSTSFKADFDRMIADCKRLNPPDSGVHTAAEDLAKIFEQMWSTRHTCSHKYADIISQDGEIRSHKRKASTERPGSSEGDLQAKKGRDESRPIDDDVQLTRRDTDENIPVHPAVNRPRQVADQFRSPAGVNVPVWEGHLTTGPGIGVNVALNLRVERVSFAKPASTLSDWKTLLPRDLRVTAHAKTQSAEEELFAHNFYEYWNTMTLSLKPASGNDSSAFGQLSEYLISKDRFATVSHQQRGNVRKIYLIPALPKSDCPENILSLAHKVLPRAQQKNSMFMVILYWVDLEDRTPIRQAWSDIIKAVHSSDMGDLSGISDRLMQHPLPIYGPSSMAVLSAEQYFVSTFSNIPLSHRFAESKTPGDSHRSFLNLSYPKLERSDSSGIDGVNIPKSVFILGRVVDRWGSVFELLIVDIENNDRPIWMIPSRARQDDQLGTTIGLLTSKFPQSLKEWDETITDKLREVQLTKQLKDTGLQIERY